MGKGGCDGRLQELRNREQVCLCFLALVGPAIIITGFLLYFFNTYTFRDSNIEGHNFQIGSYQIYTPQFSATSFRAYGQEFYLDETLDVIEDGKSLLNPYTQYKYTQNFNLTNFERDFPFEFFYKDDIGRPNGQITVSSAPTVTSITVNPSDIPCKGSTCKGSQCKLESCTTACPKNGGNWIETTQKCFYPARYLTEICVLLRDQTSEWALGSASSTDGNFGCYFDGKEKSNSIPGFNGWSPYIYGLEASPTVKFVIRLQDDPYVYSSLVTQGTYNWGDDSKNKMTFKAGFGLMIAGGIVTVLSIIGIPLFIHWKLGKGRLQRASKSLRNGGLEEREIAMNAD